MEYDKTREWIFTFGFGQPNEGKCVRIQGDYGEARKKMMDLYGPEWGFQYPAEQWEEWKKDPDRAWMMEKEVNINETYRQL